MRLPIGTEWVLHCVTTLAQTEPETATSAAQLATYYDLPVASLAKQLQSLVKSGILIGSPGPGGGFRMGMDPDRITLLAIVEAVDGAGPHYICREIRQRGTGALPPSECKNPCILAVRMDEAHRAWRDSLASVTVADVLAELPDEAPARTRRRLIR